MRAAEPIDPHGKHARGAVGAQRIAARSSFSVHAHHRDARYATLHVARRQRSTAARAARSPIALRALPDLPWHATRPVARRQRNAAARAARRPFALLALPNPPWHAARPVARRHRSAAARTARPPFALLSLPNPHDVAAPTSDACIVGAAALVPEPDCAHLRFCTHEPQRSDGMPPAGRVPLLAQLNAYHSGQTFPLVTSCRPRSAAEGGAPESAEWPRRSS